MQRKSKTKPQDKYTQFHQGDLSAQEQNVYHEHHSELHLILGTAYLLACK